MWFKKELTATEELIENLIRTMEEKPDEWSYLAKGRNLKGYVNSGTDEPYISPANFWMLKGNEGFFWIEKDNGELYSDVKCGGNLSLTDNQKRKLKKAVSNLNSHKALRSLLKKNL